MTIVEKTKFRIQILSLIVLFAAFSRLIPHAPNFTPIISIALFGGTYFSLKKLAFLIPLLAMVISDICLTVLYGYTFFSLMRLVIYGTFMTIVTIGFIVKKVTPLNIVIASLAASVLFFLTSNYMVWAGSTMYPQNVQGMVACYIAAIPFYRNTIMSALVYSSILYGAFEFAQYKFPILSRK